MLSADWQNKAIKCIDEVMEHPASALFRSPVEQGTDTDRDYYAEIKNPQDFGSIRERLVKKEYKSVKKLMDDVELIWKNAEQFNGQKSDVATLAKYCMDIFRKLLRENNVLVLTQWCSEVYRLRTKITEQMMNLPSKVRQFSSSLTAGRSLKQHTPLISEKDLSNFVAASEKLQTEEDHREMLRILNENQPELDNGNAEITLDITRLTDQTINALRSYMRDALEKRGLKYPE